MTIPQTIGLAIATIIIGTTLAVIGISIYGAHLAKLRDQRAADGVNWSLAA